MAGLLITDLPVVTIEQLRTDVREAREALIRPAYTREQRIARDELAVRLHQDDWHLSNAIKESRQ